MEIPHILAYLIHIKRIIVYLIRLKTYYTHRYVFGASPSDLDNPRVLGGGA